MDKFNMKSIMKGFKVSDINRSRSVGIACSSLVDLVNKGKIKLNIPKKQEVKVFLVDGTEVESEEYFQSLSNQTVLLLKREGEMVPSGADIIYNALRSVNIDLIRAGETVQQFMDENIKEKVRILADIINEKKDESRASFSDREGDPDWFVGLDTNAKTKEDFMFRRSQERIRGYLYKSKSDIKKSGPYTGDDRIRHVIDDVFANFSTTLQKDRYFGCLFDRREDGALCDDQGKFKCSGVWKSKSCLYNNGRSHDINPYSSREERIVFSTWNLDHCIERSRSVIPSLMTAAEYVTSQEGGCAVNVSYFYSLLFTTNNLRLVHIVCHDKGKHTTAKCDPKQFTIHLTSKTSNSPRKSRRVACVVD